jgi:hypothetical protein
MSLFDNETNLREQGKKECINCHGIFSIDETYEYSPICSKCREKKRKKR